jgi:hypothetical protein
VARADPAHRALDERMELHTGLAVVVVGIERGDRRRREHRIEAAESALLADHDGRVDALHAKRARARVAPTHRTRRHALRARVERAHARPVEIARAIPVMGARSVRARAPKVNRSTVHA